MKPVSRRRALQSGDLLFAALAGCRGDQAGESPTKTETAEKATTSDGATESDQDDKLGSFNCVANSLQMDSPRPSASSHLGQASCSSPTRRAR